MKISLLFWVLISSTVMAAQEYVVAADTNYAGGWRSVISTDGLNLRAQPKLHSKVLKTVSFGEKIQVISPQHFGRDTVGQLEYSNFEGKPYQIPIDGYWLKVRYKQTEGYMFSAYLGWDITKVEEDDKQFNQDFVLLFSSISCISNVFYRPDWHWYGVYKQGNDWSMKKVKVSFYNIPMDLVSDVISTSDNRNLQFVIGSRTPLAGKAPISKLGFGQSVEYKPLFSYTDWQPVDSTLKRYNLAISRDTGHNFWDTQKLVFQRNGIKQEVKSPSSDGNWFLLWCGDLDGDGNDDYIIQFGDKGAKTILYLSKPASKGQLLKPVAVYYSGYCC